MVKDLLLSLLQLGWRLWRGFDPWPGNFCMLWAKQKKKKKKKKEKEKKNERNCYIILAQNNVDSNSSLKTFKSYFEVILYQVLGTLRFLPNSFPLSPGLSPPSWWHMGWSRSDLPICSHFPQPDPELQPYRHVFNKAQKTPGFLKPLGLYSSVFCVEQLLLCRCRFCLKYLDQAFPPLFSAQYPVLRLS